MKLSVYCFAASVSCVAISTFADEAPQDLQEVVVTAQRRSERIQDVPITITQLSSEQLKQANAQSPGGHLKIPHPWPGQNPPPDGGGTGDDYAV